MKKSGAEIIVALLERQGIEVVAGIPGGANLPLYDALTGSRIRHVLARHEQGAGFIAQGIARATGRAAVCFGTSGPGATNLLTAIADAKLDSVPVVAITGQVATSLIGTDAFQEVDTYGLTLPITKHNFIIRDAAELLEVIPEAFAIAQSGRPGPVVVDVPKDVQQQFHEFDAWPELGVPRTVSDVDETLISAFLDRLHQAERPIIYAGGGVIASDAADALAVLARRNNIPVALTLAGLGAFPCDDPLYLGMLGMHGSRATNTAMDEADLVLALGVRFDDRATGRVADFCCHGSIIHVDIDPSEIDKIKPANLAIVGDVGKALCAVSQQVRLQDRAAWNSRITELKAAHPMVPPVFPSMFNPVQLIERLGELCGPETIITTDVGQHQMWVAQAYPFRRPRTFQTSGGLGTMGFGLPAAIGAALACPNTPVVCVSGDGSLLMNIQELATLAELNLNVKVVLLNNQHLGLVRQQQELFYGQRYIASAFQTSPDFAAIAAGFGIRSYDMGTNPNGEEALWHALQQAGPGLINVPIHAAENVLPMVPPGKANHESIGGEAIHASLSA